MEIESVNVDMNIDNNSAWVYCLPVSGGALVSHLALLQIVYDARVKSNNEIKRGYFSYAPHIVLASSGGNVSAFIGQASDWKSHAIERNVMNMNSNMFVKKWVPEELSLVPDIPFFLSKGSLYNQGIGARPLFKSLFTPSTIQRSELWLGTYDIKHKKAQFFCNKSQSDSYVTEPFFNEEQSLYYAMPLKFMDGDIDKLADICIASATIPAVVPSKNVDGLLYADGGVMYPSPLSVLHKEILRIITGKERVPISKSFQLETNTERNTEFIYSEQKEIKEKNLRMIYFYPYQPNGLVYPGTSRDLSIRNYLDSILNVGMMQDRNTAIELLNILSPDGLETETYITLNTDRLAEIMRFLSTKKHYLIEMFPHRNPSINIIHIDGPSMIAAMNLVKRGFGAQVWYSKQSI